MFYGACLVNHFGKKIRKVFNSLAHGRRKVHERILIILAALHVVKTCMKNRMLYQSRFPPHCFDMFVDCWENLIPGNKITFIICTRIEIASFEHEINSHPSNVFCAVLISFYQLAIRISVYEYELIIDDGIDS